MISLLTVFIERKENIWKKRRSLYAPATGAPVSHSLLKYSLFQFASLWRNKELDLPVWRVKIWQIFGTKSVQQAANGPVWTPQVQEPLCHIHFWRITLSNMPLSGVIRNWTSQYEGWKVGIFLEQNQLNMQQVANGPVWTPQVQEPLCHIHFWRITLSNMPLSGVIRNWTSQYEGWKVGTFLEQNQLNRL